MNNGEIRETLIALARDVTTQVNFSMEPSVSDVESTMNSWLRVFVSMNLPIFVVCMVGEDLQHFIDEVNKIVHDIGVTSV